MLSSEPTILGLPLISILLRLCMADQDKGIVEVLRLGIQLRNKEFREVNVDQDGGNVPVKAHSLMSSRVNPVKLPKISSGPVSV